MSLTDEAIERIAKVTLERLEDCDNPEERLTKRQRLEVISCLREALIEVQNDTRWDDYDSRPDLGCDCDEE